MILDLHLLTFLMLYFIIGIVIFIFYKQKKNRKIQIAAVLFLAFYLLCLFKVTLLPIHIYDKADLEQLYTMHQRQYTQLIPFRTILKTLQSGTWKIQMLGNVLLLFPVPFFCKYLKKKGKFKCGRTFLVGFLVSVGIESLQVIENLLTGYTSRIFDIDDILLNMLGVCIGILVCKLFEYIPQFENTIYMITRKDSKIEE